MRKILLFFICFFALPCFAGEIKFAQVTDVHFTSGSEYKKEVLERTVKDINKQHGLAFVVFTGDNIDSANVQHLKEFIKTANKLNAPYYVVIGNHDVFKNGGLSKEEYIKAIRRHTHSHKPKNPNYVFQKDGFTFIVVDGAKEVIPGPNGYFKEDTLSWLDKELDKYKNRPVVIFQHFPLVEPRPVRSHTTYKADVYLEMLKKHEQVAAVVSGHYHMNSETMLDGIYHINTPSLLAEPHYYKIITIVTTRKFAPMIYTELKEVK
jgi:3',5'-cyclic AMP phosphodiesterase CpdA